MESILECVLLAMENWDLDKKYADISKNIVAQVLITVFTYMKYAFYFHAIFQISTIFLVGGEVKIFYPPNHFKVHKTLIVN